MIELTNIEALYVYELLKSDLNNGFTITSGADKDVTDLLNVKLQKYLRFKLRESFVNND